MGAGGLGVSRVQAFSSKPVPEKSMASGSFGAGLEAEGDAGFSWGMGAEGTGGGWRARQLNQSETPRTDRSRRSQRGRFMKSGRAG